MNERIVNLLKLCIKSNEKGHDVTFYYSSNLLHITVDVNKENKVKNYIAVYYLEEEKIEEAETYLKELIGSESNDTGQL